MTRTETALAQCTATTNSGEPCKRPAGAKEFCCAHDPDLWKQCGAKKRNGEPCPAQAVRGRDRCRMHGGTQPRGPASGAFKHGRYSSVFPQHLRDRYECAREDPDLLSLRDEIALMVSRAQLVLEEGETPSLTTWHQLSSAWALMTSGVFDDQMRGRADMAALMAKGALQAERWDELRSTIEQHRKLSESETKRMAALDQTVTVAQVMALVARLYDSVVRHVSDGTVVEAIGTDLRSIVDGDARGRVLDVGAVDGRPVHAAHQ